MSRAPNPSLPKLANRRKERIFIMQNSALWSLGDDLTQHGRDAYSYVCSTFQSLSSMLHSFDRAPNPSLPKLANRRKERIFIMQNSAWWSLGEDLTQHGRDAYSYVCSTFQSLSFLL